MAGFGKLSLMKILTALSKMLRKTICKLPPFHQPKLTTNTRKCSSLINNNDSMTKQTLVFDLEGALLKSSSTFAYFMLVACEGGGLLRAFLLLALYPLVCLVGKEMGLKIMVFVAFVGVRKDRFNIGRAVLPKFFLEDIGREGLDVVMKCERRVGVSELPRVMVEWFLKEYLGVQAVVARELMVVHGYYVGLMVASKEFGCLNKDVEDKKLSGVFGFGFFNKSLVSSLLLHCQEIYVVTEAEKKTWKNLESKSYPKPLIFHDGRLAFKPNPVDTLSMFMWLPFGLVLSVIRIILGILLPYKISIPVLALLGQRYTATNLNPEAAQSEKRRQTGMLYVCNHRTLLDPIYVSGSILKPVTAVTYGMSRFSEILAPINTVRLTRNRDRDRALMAEMLSQGNLVVCPEGTTCREPYLLRFSPLFAELTDEIIPVAMDIDVSMFYGTTASGLKCLDPFCHYLNPYPGYNVRILSKMSTGNAYKIGGQASIEVANRVQSEIAKALGFECTNWTRKEKYMILAGNEGIVW